MVSDLHTFIGACSVALLITSVSTYVSWEFYGDPFVILNAKPPWVICIPMGIFFMGLPLLWFYFMATSGVQQQKDLERIHKGIKDY
mmetsp:Transcript_64881/g.143276  ORF Transcript_64881/g.143276 Transcript_64881/m.143276 type:complete len:86 (+) Transcript_64881:71-328(+)